MTMTIKNLTPHALNIKTSDGWVTVPPSGVVARIASTATRVGSHEGISLSRITFGEVTGLPAEEPGVLLVVSALVRLALPARADLASPGEPVRDALGVTGGCIGLVVN